MKCFSVSESSVTPRIPITLLPYPHIGVGEEGRGRTYVRFPVAQRFAESLGENPQVERASIIKTKEKGTLLLVEEKNPEDNRVLVLVDIAAGYRGSTDWTGTDRKQVPCPHRGAPRAEYRCVKCGTDYPAVKQNDLFWTNQNIHPDAGEVWEYAPFPPSGVIVLAEGFCAQGTAGRMGGHVVRLLIMEPKTSFRVVRSGRLYGAPSQRYVFWDGELLHLGTRDEVWPPTQEADEGELI